MITDMKEIMAFLGVPKFIIVVSLVASILVSGTLFIEHFIMKRETALQTTVQYIPKSQKTDSLILVIVTENQRLNKSHFDSIEKHIKVTQLSIKAGNDVTKQKFDLIIQNNSALKQSFDGLDNSFNWFMQTIGSTEKKKLTQPDLCSINTPLK
jgi:hypothetical protein